MASKQHIILKGCRQNNLKNISVKLPKIAISVITGVSGSGKSSLAFDTLYAEGQRRFLEYLSPQARQLIRQLPKPAVDIIEGLSPTLAVQQSNTVLSPLSTVATYTDVYDFLCLLFARVGQQHSPTTGRPLTRYTRQEIIELLLTDYPEGQRLQLLAPVVFEYEGLEETLQRLQKMGFLRLRLNGQDFEAGQAIPDAGNAKVIDVVVDRVVIREGLRERLSNSVETAMDLSQGILKVIEGVEGNERFLTEVFLCSDSGVTFTPLEPADFNYHSPRGACPTCQGRGGKEVDDKWERCLACLGSRLKAEALACLIARYNIADITAMTVDELLGSIDQWPLTDAAARIAAEIIPQIKNRLAFLQEVGLGYLELNRSSRTLSEGEAQRVLLASQVGAGLSGILYVLDEPSRGLHRRDITHLAKVLSQLKAIGNSIVLVEHEPMLIAQSDHVVEIGPGSGTHGGQVIFEGTYAELQTSDSPTGLWLSGRRTVPTPKKRRKSLSSLKVSHACCHNLKDVTVDIPLGVLTGLCGLSGSGKSTLAIDVIAAELGGLLAKDTPTPHLTNANLIQRLQVIEQRPSGVTVRSTPATFVGIMTALRQLYAMTKLSRARGYTQARFTTNKKGGRCEACEGLGFHRVNMAFMPELFVTCEVCKGKRYNYETLQVLWEGLSIADALDLSVEQALKHFSNIPQLANPLQLMQELGLDYLTLGQHFNTLSGGEIQRLKLIAELTRSSSVPTLYIMDEPCVGLHFSDVAKLTNILHRLVDEGHSVLVVEHNLLLLQQCDWLIEMGPEGGPKGGHILFQGTPEQLAKAPTPTGEILAGQRTS